MESFAHLLDRLGTAPGRNARLRLIGDWLKATPDPDRGWGMAALTGDMKLAAVKPALLRALITDRVDETLFLLSYDYVGDLAETVALLWPGSAEGASPPLGTVVEQLMRLSRQDAPKVLVDLLDRLDSSGRFALLKLATGNLRIGVGGRLARTAFAEAFDLDVDEVEELWHSVTPPYENLLAWAEGRGERPDPGQFPRFRPFMLAHPLKHPEKIDVQAFAVEWKWDGIRAMAVCAGDGRRLYSRDGNDISGAFPEIVEALPAEAVVDGEILVRDQDGVGLGTFNALQQRLNRKLVSAALARKHPAFLRCYDLLFDGGEDIRNLPYTERRQRLGRLLHDWPSRFFDMSHEVEVAGLDEMAALRMSPPDPLIEGLMLKRRSSPYVAGRRAGLWYKWKRDPRTADCVLMYAQRGHGKRAGYYSDFTFGAWDEEGRLLPVGKAYFGFTDEELRWLDGWVRKNTIARFGPVREVEKQLVLEIAFDAVQQSGRHKSGLAMRFPRIARIRKDKPAAEADRIDTLMAMIGG